MVFGRKDSTCPRCQELLAGAEPRQGYGARQIISNGKIVWQSKAQQEQAKSQEIHNHYQNHEQNCDYAKRGVPCVAFDY